MSDAEFEAVFDSIWSSDLTRDQREKLVIWHTNRHSPDTITTEQLRDLGWQIHTTWADVISFWDGITPLSGCLFYAGCWWENIVDD